MKLLSVIFFLSFFAACSTVQQTTKSEEQTQDETSAEPEIYIFDDISTESDSSANNDNQISEEPESPLDAPPVNLNANDVQFIVQVGAFTTKKRAELYVGENQSKLTYNLVIAFSEEVGLWVVQLPKFSTRAEAEKVRNELWQSGNFGDAFIITSE
ncbi:MAG: SPOR domain-containing protein [Melioribacteraceae bacterium]|nr:SPOR domain-containing protein [Melioribacteraceae bacterium]MCF8264568.1 SPOR domain-containing protein [Melioribacteraceae bacterium]MCF8413725.1 SPOR domain-containing protein [Melioribacteraceae bacterium]